MGQEPAEETPFHRPGREAEAAGLAPLLDNVENRRQQALHGAWRFIVDQADLGETNPMMHGGVGRGETHSPDELLEYSFEGDDVLEVPGDWNTQRPELFWYRGVIWYCRDFDHAVLPGRHAYLYFGGANFRTTVYLNGTLLARHTGGFTPFNLDVTRFLQPGCNRLVVKVDSLSGPADVPTEFNDWLNYGGLTREVLLVDLPRTFVRCAGVRLVDGTFDRIGVEIELGGSSPAGRAVRLRIAGLGVDCTLQADSEGRIRAELDASPVLWSPRNPHRYAVEVLLDGEAWRDEIGFRQLAIQGNQICLNGDSIYLRGIALHEERLSRPGRAWGAEDAARVVAEVRALGANFVRLAHYPHNEAMVRACDAAGILVWAELPVYHAIAFDCEDTLESARLQYADLIRRDRNRAAVALWSVANETEPGPARNAFLARLAEHVRNLDPSRLVTAALHGNHDMRRASGQIAARMLDRTPFSAAETLDIHIDDPLAEHLDVLGYNEYFGWYTCAPIARELRRRGVAVSEAQVREFMLECLPHLRFHAVSGKPVVISEFGGEAVAGRRSDGLDVFSEDYQARLYQQQLAMLAASPDVRGLSPWILKDFRAPYRLHTRLQQYWNRKGLLSEHGVRKLAFEELARHYHAIADD